MSGVHKQCECGSTRYRRFESYLYCRSCGRPYNASNRKKQGFDSPGNSAASHATAESSSPEAEARTRQFLAELGL